MSIEEIRNAEKNDGMSPETRIEPPPGSWAATARMMASMFPEDEYGLDWDAWKDEMKEADL